MALVSTPLPTAPPWRRHCCYQFHFKVQNIFPFSLPFNLLFFAPFLSTSFHSLLSPISIPLPVCPRSPNLPYCVCGGFQNTETPFSITLSSSYSSSSNPPLRTSFPPSPFPCHQPFLVCRLGLWKPPPFRLSPQSFAFSLLSSFAPLLCIPFISFFCYSPDLYFAQYSGQSGATKGTPAIRNTSQKSPGQK